MNFFIDNEEYVDSEDVQNLVGIKQTLLYEKVRYGQFPRPYEKKVDVTLTFKRKRKLWKRSEIEAYIESNKEK